MEPEILITVSFRLPQSDRQVLAEHLKSLIQEAIICAGDTVHVSLQPYDPEDDEDED